jgi:hypothetical protein
MILDLDLLSNLFVEHSTHQLAFISPKSLESIYDYINIKFSKSNIEGVVPNKLII